jgi:hypothetical protein
MIGVSIMMFGVGLAELAHRLVENDGDVDLYKFCFYRILRLNLDQSLGILPGLDGEGSRTLLLAICETAAHDGRLNVAEGELVRVICTSFDCPMPSILADNR